MRFQDCTQMTPLDRRKVLTCRWRPSLGSHRRRNIAFRVSPSADSVRATRAHAAQRKTQYRIESRLELQYRARGLAIPALERFQLAKIVSGGAALITFTFDTWAVTHIKCQLAVVRAPISPDAVHRSR